MRCRSQFRSEDFMKRFADATFDATAARFFAFLRVVWGFAAAIGNGRGETVVSSHAEWLPAMGKWGGISSRTVRRHWCDCICDVLRGVREAGGVLNGVEVGIFKKLLDRRELWTDQQVWVPIRLDCF